MKNIKMAGKTYVTDLKGLSPNEVADYYSKWAENQRYDNDLHENHYFGPKLAADSIAKLYPDNRENKRILDVACGTGFVGKQLYKLNFRDINGLDPSEGMLKTCKETDIYHNLYQEYCCETPTSIKDSTYDCAVVSGGFGEGQIPCSGICEMIRVVKTGGYIVIAMRKAYLNNVAEYADRFEPYLKTLEKEGKITMVERREVERYSFENRGLVFIYRVTK